MTLKELVRVTKGRLVSGDDKDIFIGGICIDPALISRNDVFVITNADYSFFDDVFDKASVIITDRFIDFKCKIPVIKVRNCFRAIINIGRFNRNKFIDKPLIAVTGSVGKSSVCSLLYSIFKSQYNVLMTFNNYCDLIGVSIMLSHISDKYDIIILEFGMSSYLDISRLSRLVKPSTCIITNIVCSHINCLGNQDNIFKTKMGIVSGMRSGNLIVNGNDFYLNKVRECSRYSVIKVNDDIVDNLIFGDRLCFDVCIDGKIYNVNFCGLNSFFVDDILLCITCASLYCVSTLNIIRSINGFNGF